MGKGQSRVVYRDATGKPVKKAIVSNQEYILRSITTYDQASLFYVCSKRHHSIFLKMSTTTVIKRNFIDCHRRQPSTIPIQRTISSFCQLRRCRLCQWRRGWRADPIRRTSRTKHSNPSSGLRLEVRKKKTLRKKRKKMYRERKKS